MDTVALLLKPLSGATESAWTAALVLAVVFAIRYLAFAGIAFAIGYRRGGAHRGKLQPAMPAAAQVRRELAYSAVAVLVFGAVGGVLAASGALPHAQVYRDIAARGAAWFVASIALALVVHDAWFYWTHRLLHWRPLFPHVHRIHHLSTNPTPWTAYAFHPAESVVQAAGVVIVVFVVPMHPAAIAIFQAISTAVNVYGHCGYELYPRGWASHPVGRWINTSVSHNVHHATTRYNYGLYFLAWDRWMGTLDPAYEQRYETAKARATPAA